MRVVSNRERSKKMKNQYERQERWCKENLKRYSFSINKNLDKNLIDFIEEASKKIGKGELFRFAVQMIRLITDDLSVLTTYKADNGDEFVRIVRHDLPQPDTMQSETKCVAVLQTRPVQHLSYYTEDGEFIATAGTHIHTRLGVMTEFLYTKRVSDKTQNDTITETLGYTEKREKKVRK